MKHCAKCNVESPDSYSFCKFCGGPLSEISAIRVNGESSSCPACRAEVKSGWRFCKQCAYDLQAGPASVEIPQVQAVTPVAGFGSAAAVAPTQVIEPDEQTRVFARSHALQCRKCGALITQGLTACSVCGTAIGGVLGPMQVSRRLQLGLIAAAAVVLLAVGGFAAYYFWFSNAAIERRLDAAITTGNLFKPEGNSAYDLYNRLKQHGAGDEALAPYRDRLLPALTSQPLKLLTDFAVPTNREPNLSEWQDAQKPMTWATELKTDDGPLAARARYIEGRVAYLSNKKDDALSLWKSASELDKTWALATNAVGVLYNERKGYQTARQFALEAIRREPNWAVPYNNVGTSYLLEKNDDKAESYYLQAIERAPNWPRPHVWLGDIAMRRRDFYRAVSEYEAVLNLAVPGTTTLDLAEIKKRLELARMRSQGFGDEDTREIARANSSWPAFYAAFRAAAKKRDRAALRGMIASPFLTQVDGEFNSPDEVLKWLDESRLWQELEREVGTPISAGDVVLRGRPTRCAEGIFCFEFGSDGKWRLAAQVENELED
jgi:tetratricopeptide (TPR) repeat protein